MEARKISKGRAPQLGSTILGAAAALSVTGCLILLGALCGIQRVTETKVFAPKTMINGLALDNQSYIEGERSVRAAEAAALDGIGILLRYNGAEKTFDSVDLGVTTNSMELLQKAYARNKTGAMLADFDLTGMAFSGQSELILDEARMSASIEAFLRENDIPAKDAEARFDPVTRTFTYAEESAGVKADAIGVRNIVKQKLLQGDYQPSSINVNDQFAYRVEPVITQNQLQHNTLLVGECTTIVNDNADRNVNIQLMCDAVDGMVIVPGETLSINELVGQRTEAKGFRAAPAIVDGKLADSIGGGICQLAGTLYNAALLADMDIVERVHHTWPSEYLPIGLDATLNWDNKDLKLKNRSDYPIYISAMLETPMLTVEIYGAPPPDGLEIDVDNQILKEIPAPDPELIYTNKLLVGKQRVKERSRKGYEVAIYRRYWKDGQLVREELIAKDRFRPMRGTTYVGTDGTIK